MLFNRPIREAQYVPRTKRLNFPPPESQVLMMRIYRDVYMAMYHDLVPPKNVECLLYAVVLFIFFFRPAEDAQQHFVKFVPFQTQTSSRLVMSDKKKKIILQLNVSAYEIHRYGCHDLVHLTMSRDLLLSSASCGGFFCSGIYFPRTLRAASGSSG